MTQPTTRTTFKDYCKRKLGHPVVELNLDDDQMKILLMMKKISTIPPCMIMPHWRCYR